MSKLDIADQYFACVRARDIDGLLALYDEDAVFVSPVGRELKGKEAIREMQLGVFAASAPMPTPLAKVTAENLVAVEIAARLPDGQVINTANFYHLSDEGRIKRLSVYMRSA